MDTNGVPFTSAYIASTGNPIVDLQEKGTDPKEYNNLISRKKSAIFVRRKYKARNSKYIFI